MEFEWNAAKSARCRRERGFDFGFASLIFSGPTLEWDDDRFDYGEIRIIAGGLAAGIAITVVYTDRKGKNGILRRIISARRSNRQERKAYGEVP